MVNRDLQASAGTNGVMLGCVGIGAITGAVLLLKLRARIDPERIVLIATAVYEPPRDCRRLCRALTSSEGKYWTPLP